MHRTVDPSYVPRVLGVYDDSSYNRIYAPLKLLTDEGKRCGWANIEAALNIRPGDYDAVLLPVSFVEYAEHFSRRGFPVISDGYIDSPHIHGHILEFPQETKKPSTALRTFVDPRLWLEPARYTLTIGLMQATEDQVPLLRRVIDRVLAEFPLMFYVSHQLAAHFTGHYSLSKPRSQLERVRQFNSISIALCPEGPQGVLLEHGLAQSAVVGSPFLPINGKGTAAITEEEWYQGIKKYIQSTEKREVAGRNLHRYVVNHRNVARHYLDIEIALSFVYRTIIGPMKEVHAA